MNFRIAAPSTLVDLARIGALKGFAVDGDVIRVGAMTRQRDLERDAAVRRANPLIAEVLGNVAHIVIRNRGTVGGSIAHADAAAELPCMLVATGGSVVARRVGGERTVAADDLFQFHMTTTLEAGELLTEVHIPALPVDTGYAFQEVARRHGDYALAGVCALVTLKDGVCTAVSLAACGVASKPTRLDAAEQALLGAPPRGGRDRQGGRRGARLRNGRRRPPGQRGIPQGPGGGAGQADRDQGRRPGTGARVMARPAARRKPLGQSPDPQVAVSMTVNGERIERQVSPRMLLSDFIRHELGLTGTHVGCEHGVCGCCTVMIDGRAGRSCLAFAVQADGADIRTVESVAGPDGTLHPVQQAFRECHALQCGYCTPGFVMSIVSYLEENPDPDLSEDAIREVLSGNLCRCTGYKNIVAAFRRGAELMRDSR